MHHSGTPLRLLLALLVGFGIPAVAWAGAEPGTEKPVPNASDDLGAPPGGAPPAPLVEEAPEAKPAAAPEAPWPEAQPAVVPADDAAAPEAETPDAAADETAETESGADETEIDEGDEAEAGDDAPGDAAPAPAPEEDPYLRQLDPETGRWIPSEDIQKTYRTCRAGFRGSVQLLGRARWGDGERDTDLYQYLRLEYGREDAVGWSASFHGRLSQDLDGNIDNDGFYVFDSVTDTFGDRVKGYVYSAYVNYRPSGRSYLEELRIGRQYVETGEYLSMDGVRATFRPGGPRGVGVSVYGGIPTHLYESSPDGDVMAGVGVEVPLGRGGTARLDYLYLEDDNRFYGSETVNLISLEARGQMTQSLYGRAQYQHLNGDPRYLTGEVNWNHLRRDVFVRATWRALLETQNELAYDIDPYFAIAQELEPYWDGSLSVAKGFGNCVYVEVGVAGRQLFDDDDEGRYNREFERYFAAVSVEDFGMRHMALTVTGEIWEGGEDDIYTMSFDLEYKPSPCWRGRLGTDFSLYRYDFYADDERIENYGYYLRITHRPNKRWRYDGQIRIDDDDFDTYVTLRLSAELSF
ncbi:MAG: hypothetical protein QNJ98_16300 [Planctomycetota bacterium]|nr:hypothetical protein [Planctomycetota bacterium]